MQSIFNPITNRYHEVDDEIAQKYFAPTPDVETIYNPLTGGYSEISAEDALLFYPERAAKPTPLHEPEVEWADYGRSIMAGGANVAAGLGWLTDKIDGGTGIGKAIETVGNDAVDYWNDRLSEGARRELAKEFVKKTDDGYEWGDPSWSTVGLLGAQSLLGTAAGAGIGAGATKVLQLFGNPVGRSTLVRAVERGARAQPGTRAAAMAEAARKKLKLVDSVLGAAGFGVGEGTVGGAMTGVNVEREVMKLPEERLFQSERFKEIYDSTHGLMDEAQGMQYARETLAKEAASVAGFQAGITTAALGAPMGAYFGPLLSKVATGRPGSILKGAAGEALQEFAQSGTEQYLTNKALRGAGSDVDPWQGVLNAAVGGAAAGAPLGGAMATAGPTDRQVATAEQQRQHQVDGTDFAPLVARAHEAKAAGASDDEILPIMNKARQPGQLPPALVAMRKLREQKLAEAKTAEPQDIPEAAVIGGPEAAAQAKQKPGIDLTGMGPAIAENLRAQLWEAAQKGKTRMAGVADPVLAAVKPEMAAGRIKTREQFDAFVNARYGKTREAKAVPTKGQVSTPAELDAVAQDAATSPQNERAEPTERQIEAGNFKKPRVKIPHLPEIRIENPKGSKRRGTRPDGTEWEHELTVHYGYFTRTTGADNQDDGTPREGVDVFVGPQATDPALPVFVIDQKNPDGSFDEAKVLAGFATEDEARQAYLAQYEDGWDGLGAITQMSADELRAFVNDDERTSHPVAYQPQVKPDGEEETQAAATEATDVLEAESRVARQPIATRDIETDTAVTPAGRDVPVRYAVVEASDLIASQTDEGRVNPDYPAELQPRDRARAVSQQQIQDIARNINPRLLDRSPRASDGAPIIAPDGVIESGNGRVLAIRRAYAEGGAEGYWQYLADQGYPVEGISQPVLVRVREGELEPEARAAFTREANERDTLGMSATERAMADAAAIPESLLELYRGGDVDTAQNRDFVRAFLDKVVAKNEQAGVIAADGALSQEATRRIEGALLAKAYGDADLVATLIESADTNIRAIGGALMDVAAGWAQMRSETANGRIDHAMDQTAQLLEAVRLVQRARREGRSIAEFVGQQDLLSGSAIHPVGEAFLRLMFRNTRSWTQPTGRDKLAEALRFYLDQAARAQPGFDLLGETAPPPDRILSAAKERQYGSETAVQSDLLAQPAGGPVERVRGPRDERDSTATKAAPTGKPEAEGTGARGVTAEAPVTQSDIEDRSYAKTNERDLREKSATSETGPVAGTERAETRVTESPAAPTAEQLESEIPYQVAYNAHTGTSFAPERRAQQEKADYANQLLSDYEYLEGKVRNDAEREIFEREWARYHQNFRSRFLAYLGARDGLVSSFIAGPARFPVARMQKKNNTVDRRLAELLDLRKKALASIVRKLRPELAPTRVGDEDAAETWQKKVDAKERRQEQMKAVNKVLRKGLPPSLRKKLKEARDGLPSNLTEAEQKALDAKLQELQDEFGLGATAARGIITPDFMGRIGFADYQLSNNNAQIRRLRQQIVRAESYQAERAEAGGVQEIAFDKGTIELDYDENRIRVRIEKSDTETREKLKAAGFRWSPKNVAWQRQLTENAKAATVQATGAVLEPKAEPTIEDVPEATIGVEADERQEYDGRYEPPATNVREPAPVSAAEQGDLFAAPELSREEQRAEATTNYKILVRQEETGEIKVGIDTVRTPEDAAHVLAPFRRHAQETMVAIVTDSNDKILNVIRHSKGGVDGTSVYPAYLTGAVLSTPGAANVWFGHNHPSGASRESTADQKITEVLYNVLEGSPVRVRGHVVVAAGGKMAAMDPRGEPDMRGRSIQPAPRRRSIAVTERMIRGHTGGQGITNQEQLANAFRKTGGEEGILLLNNQHVPVGFVKMDTHEARKLREDGRSSRLLTAINYTNAAAIAYYSHDYIPAAAENLKRFTNAVQVRALDYLHGAHFTQGGFPFQTTNVAFKSRGAHGTSTAEAVRSQLKDAIEAASPLLTVRVVQSVSELPGNAHPDDIEGAYFNRGAVYLVADNLSQKRINEVFRHEVFGHAAMERHPDFPKWLEQIQRARRIKGSNIRKIADEVERRQGILDPLTEAKEIIALMAERNVKNSLMDRIIAAFRKFFRSIGMTKDVIGDVSDAEIRSWLAKGARQFMSDADFARRGATLTAESTDEEVLAAINVPDDRIDAAGQPLYSHAMAAEDVEGVLAPPASDSQLNRFVDETIFRFQDKFNYLYKAQKAAARDRGLNQVPEAEDAYLAELRYHGMAGAAIEDFQHDHVDPLVEAISKSGLTVEDVEAYLHARHAPEANEQLKRINPDRPDNEALSGMSDAKAAQVLDRFRREGKHTQLEEIAARVDAITKAQRDLMVEAGLESADTVKKWEATYQHYVPLHREGLDGRSATRSKGFSVAGRQRRRAGSQRAVEHILAQVVSQHEATIIRAEKAKVARALFEFATNNPNQQLYEVDKVEFQPSFGADGLVTYRPHRGFQFADNVLVVKVDGNDHMITFNERNHQARRIAHAVRGLGASDSGPIVNVLTKVMRYLALVNTGANPEFIISNFPRDLQTAFYNLSDTDADKLKWTIIKDVGKAWRGIRAFQSGKQHAWASEFDAFRKAGAQTGWMGLYQDVAQRGEDLQKKIESLSGNSSLLKIKTGLHSVLDFIERENTAVENAIRLSAFVHARRNGMSDGEAARLSKELTVNFNRKGDYGQVMNALYLFYNASIQGSARIIAAATRSPKVRKLIGATVVAAMFLDILNRALAGDDEDDKNRYDKVPDYMKERNLIIMLPEGRGDYIKIPLPWGYNVFHVLGQVMGEALTKRSFKATEGALRVADAVFSAFNPIGGEGSLAQKISPTITDPIVQWSENKDWAGRPLRPESNPFDIDKPQSQQYWNSVREPSRWITEQLNELTGGSQVRPGAVDISPEWIDLLIDTFTGGAGRFASDTLSTPVKAIQGDDVESYEIPLLRKIYGRPGAGTLFQDYYRSADAVRITEKEARHYAEIGDRKALTDLRRDRPGEYALIGMRRKTDNQLRKLRQHRNKLEASKLPAAAKRARLDKINRQIELLMNRFNRLYNQRVEQ